VRELENTIERAVVLTEDGTIKPEDLFYYGFPIDSNGNGPGEDIIPQNADFHANLEEMEKDAISRTLRHYHGHRGVAAKALGMDRKTLYRKLKKYCVDADME